MCKCMLASEREKKRKCNNIAIIYSVNKYMFSPVKEKAGFKMKLRLKFTPQRLRRD